MTSKFLLRHLLPLFMVGLTGAWLVGCDSGGDDDDDAAAAADLSGDWVITQTYSTGIADTINVNITQDGNNIGGSSSQGPLVGSISGKDLQFTNTAKLDKVFKGVVIDDNSLAGTFEEQSSGSLVREGSWVANRL